MLAELFVQAEILARGIGNPEMAAAVCGTAGWLAVLYVGILALRRVLNVVSDISTGVGVEEKCRYLFRMRLHKKVASIPYIYFEEAKIQDQLQRAEGCVENLVITDIFMNTLILGECVFSVAGLLLVMMGYSVWYLPILILTVLPYLVNRIKVGKEFYELQWFQASHVRKRDYLYSLFSSPGPQKEQRVFGFAAYILQKWKKEHGMVAEENLSFRRKDSKRLMYCEGIITLGYILSIVLSVLLLFRGEIAVGVFGVGIFVFQDVQQSTKSFFSMLGNAFNSVLEADNYFGFLDLEEEKQGDERLRDLTDRIEVRNVSFTYPNGEKPALTVDFLTVKAGERVVVVGENGSGKTTLCKILLGLYQPERGEVLYDGKPVGRIHKKDLAELVSAVSQNFVTYHLPIRHNIGIHCPESEMKDEEIEALLKKVGLEKLSGPEEYDKWLGREFDGRELSGGQWQRLAIAGAIAKSRQILFLDEPTSALDPVTEYDILHLFMEMSRGKTAVIISHRAGLCTLADKVVYMREGRIGAVGSHQELMECCEEYKDFYNEQAKWYHDGKGEH